MQKKKIVHIIPSLVKGGAERFVVDLCNELAIRGNCEIYLISLFDNDLTATFLEELSSGVIYHSLKKKKSFDPLVLIKLTKLLSKIKPDIVHTHINALEYAVCYKMANKKVAYFHTLHNDAYKECDSANVRKIRKWLYAESLIKPVTISQASSSSFRECYSLANDCLIENGRTPVKEPIVRKKREELFPVDTAGAFVIVNVARIAPAKNQALLIDAVNRFNIENEKKCFLFIIGSVIDKQLYKELLLKKTDQVYFMGSQKNISDFLYAADIFALSSIFEGMPISLIEALAAGCVPVSTPVGGIMEMLENGKTGFLSNDLSLDEYYKAISMGLKTIDKTAIKQNCIQEFNNKYNIAITAEKYMRLYEQ
ncbi:glycosyltransferase [Chitinophaga sp. 212800010-3]|uniref:glycosyltransferase n=1 Tax=unclassified Chitinophaga TaxID=2619133 RepID=UPI002DE7555B|nr:hypothetical protein [Chitinophaga sp. 212800010-3]